MFWCLSNDFKKISSSFVYIIIYSNDGEIFLKISVNSTGYKLGLPVVCTHCLLQLTSVMGLEEYTLVYFTLFMLLCVFSALHFIWPWLLHFISPWVLHFISKVNTLNFNLVIRLYFNLVIRLCFAGFCKHICNV